MKEVILAKLKPSLFTEFPSDSILMKCEPETIAVNIMVIRERLGNDWGLSWTQYKKERKTDGGFSQGEKEIFNKVIKLIPDAFGAVTFSPRWAKAARK